MSNEWKLRLTQAISYLGGPFVLIFNWNPDYFLWASLYGWVVLNVGVSIALHRYFGHTAFKPKNQFVNYLMHFLGIIVTQGSVLGWTAIHRYHHKHSDTTKDPHTPYGKSAWGVFKVITGFYKFPDISVKWVSDIIRDPVVVFTHKHYYKLLYGWMALLALIDVDLFMYGYVVPTFFIIHITFLINVTAHLVGSQDYKTNDNSRNNYLMGLFFLEAGFHNNHHADPKSFEYGNSWKQPDFGRYIIKWLATPESLKYFNPKLLNEK